jgi:hypothetical protein
MQVAALEVSDSVQKGLDTFFNFIPNLIAFIVILVVGYFVAKLVKAAVRKALQAAGLDRHLQESQAGDYVERLTPGASASGGISRIVFYIVFAFVLTIAIGALGIPAVTQFMNQVLAYLPNVIAAIVIFVVAAAIAGVAGAGVAKLMGDTPTGKIVASVVPTLVMVIGLFMVLNQLKIAEAIVTITFAALMGSLALGGALAFGLGGREVAADLLGSAYRKGREQRDQVRRDIELGKARGEQRVEEGKQRAREEVAEGGNASRGGSYRAH